MILELRKKTSSSKIALDTFCIGGKQIILANFFLLMHVILSKIYQDTIFYLLICLSVANIKQNKVLGIVVTVMNNLHITSIPMSNMHYECDHLSLTA